MSEAAMRHDSAVVVGGGVIGAACAYYLARAGFRITLVDKGGFGQACSHGNCGLVCPSHVLPLAAPGVLLSTARAMLAKDAPFRVRPGLNLGLWSWLFRFARYCNKSRMLSGGHAIQAMLVSARALYEELLVEEKINCEWEKRGLLFVFQTAKAMDHYAHTDAWLRDTFGLNAHRYDGPTLEKLEPALKPGLAGGWLHDTDAHLRPDHLMREWRRVLTERGVEIREHCEVTGVERSGKQASAVTTTQGKLSARHFVVATGAWTPLLSRWLDVKIPIQPGKGYSITMARPARCPVYPMIFEEQRVAVTPMRSGFRLGSMMEFVGYDTTVDPRRLALLRRGADHYLLDPGDEPIVESWYGWRPMTPDSIPMIGRGPSMENVWIAAGHNMLGLSMAPATGKLLAEMITGQPPHIEAQPYSPMRF